MTNDEGPVGERGPPRQSEEPVKCYPAINGKPGAPDKSEKDGEKENLNFLIFLAAMVLYSQNSVWQTLLVYRIRLLKKGILHNAAMNIIRGC